jgi:hypothetical protein
MSKIQTIIWLFIFVVIICSMNVFFGITESFGGGGGGRGGGGRGGGRGLGVGSGLGVGLGVGSGLGGGTLQNTNGGYFIPRLRLLQEDN